MLPVIGTPRCAKLFKLLICKPEKLETSDKILFSELNDLGEAREEYDIDHEG